ncbi:NACHT domain-containing protein [Streptomyces sp. NPDC057950]|uniref:NACHT domain-containing protein n=1 Tax=Streptomyces sp. NPDC057950 TaxID=3346288 RepID=UPI0036EDAFFF
MTFYYEQLDPERFQHLCQALIVREFPGTQCFPVGQRDGGRDALQVLSGDPTRSRVFQVKYVRNPFSITDAHKWVVDTMRGELPKLQSMLTAESEIVEYLLITNVPGTAFPEFGSIDTLNALLETELEVPIRVWWRDDLDRRCENSADIRWAYPDMLRGTDVLQALAEADASALHGVRLDALRTFAVAQYEDDNEVRFQQVDLSNEILNLFVDVPATVPEWSDQPKRRGHSNSHQIRSAVHRLSQLVQPVGHTVHPTQRHQVEVGAATLLLDDELSRLASLVVLEGGPGQGKSTLGQYICQVHRMKMLGMPEFEGLPDVHKPSSVRFPIRVDLREYATWLAGRNPFGQARDERRPQHLNKSLESFISYLVNERSGGRSFTPDDLALTASSSALLLVLDGLDEVAEVSLRNEVVREVTSAARRLGDSAAALQILVTTRPSALAEVNEFPPKLFHRWSLSRLGRPLIEEYASRWARSRRLKPKELANLRRVLNDKLDQPHMRDLARNPMQLAILLTVIHTRGSSLPDKRTALYDIYVELFLAREAEKSETVKLRQELLIDVHRYLAWVLHSEAETGSTLGKIESSRLKSVLRDYLVAEQRNPDLVDELFTGLSQRVVFLVGAVEGLFQFEVQPLREYFAGRYLYETAPYSPVGSPRKGTKDERFDALARNTHWLNVTRFYAGCFSKGELPSLVDRLEVLCADPDLGLTSHPRTLAATLVADWVFSQNPRSLQKTVGMILDKNGYRALLGDDMYSFDSESLLTLPEGCGRHELVLRCIDLLKESPKHDVQTALARLAQKNSTLAELTTLWRDNFADLRNEEEKMSWFLTGYYLGVLASSSEGDISEIFNSQGPDPFEPVIIKFMIMAGHINYYAQRPDRLASYIDAVQESRTGYTLPRKITTDLEFFTAAYSVSHFRGGAHNDRMTVADGLKQYGARFATDEPTQIAGDLRVNPVVESFMRLLSQPLNKAFQRNGAFESFIDDLTDEIQPAEAVWCMALCFVRACGRESVINAEPENLFAGEAGLIQRLLFARKQAGNVNWWRAQLSDITESQKPIWVCAAISLCGPATVSRLSADIDAALTSVDYPTFERIYEIVGTVLRWGADPRKIRFDDLGESLSPRLAALIASVATNSDHVILSNKYLADYQGNESPVLNALYFAVLHRIHGAMIEWAEVLSSLKKIYGSAGFDLTYHPGVYHIFSEMPIDIARTVTSRQEEYPRFLVIVAESVVKRDNAKKAIPLSRVAADGEWFSEQ